MRGGARICAGSLCVDGRSGWRGLIAALPKGGAPLLRYVDHFESGGDAVLKSACKLSLEGIVSKALDAPYTEGRSDTWTKAKCRAGHEVVIGGWTSNAGAFRSLLVGVHRGEKLVHVGRVGHRIRARYGGAADAAFESGRASDKNPIYRSWRATQRRGNPLAAGRTLWLK